MILGSRDKTKIRQTCKISDYLGVQYNGRGSILVEHPFRNDQHPSFSIFTGSDGNQLWGDLAIKSTGDIIQLHREITGCSFGEACRFLGKEWNTSFPVRQSRIITERTSIRKATPKLSFGTMATEISPVVSKETYIPRPCGPATASSYLHEIGITIPDWTAKQLGAFSDQRRNLIYLMQNGCLHIRGTKTREGRRFAGNYGDVSFTVFGDLASTHWAVSEGIGDMLALLTMETISENIAYMILNSTGTTYSAIAYLLDKSVTAIRLFLDNDQPKSDGSLSSGDLATGKFTSSFPEAAIDMRHLYQNFKDPLEWFQAVGH